MGKTSDTLSVGGLAIVKLNGKYGYIDTSGREVIPLKYNGAEKFIDGLAGVTLNDKSGYIGPDGKEYFEN